MAHQEQLSNGLNVVSFKQAAEDFGAVFVVPTPAVDSSGIAHLVEHLVFRTSDRYSARQTLFAANSLLPLKMNASSHNGFSYFYAVSPIKPVLIQAIDYLLAGLQQCEYSDDDIRRERDGVIARELAMYEATADYQQQMAVWRGDRSPDCYHHWGGYCDTISQLKANDVADYKAQYYQASRITLLLSGVTKDELLTASHSPFYTSSACYTPRQHRFTAQTLEDDCIFSWWLPECYLDGLLSAKTRLKALLNKYNMQVIVEDSPNYQQKFAFRIIGRPGQLMAAQQALIDEIKFLRIVPKQHLFFESKYPESINSLLAWYHGQQPLNRKVVALTQALSVTPTITSLKPLPKPIVRLVSRAEPQHAKCELVQAALAHTSPVLPDKLPSRVAALAEQRQTGQTFLCNQHDWIYWLSLEIPGQSAADVARSLLENEQFWLPRMSGQCYAMGVKLEGTTLICYGVMDDEPHRREQEIQRLFNTLNTSD